MDKINFQNGVTKVNADTFNTFQNNIEKAINEAMLAVKKAENPIGHIRMETTDVNPANYLGFGTWVLWGSGRVPVGVDTTDDDFAEVEKTGGEKAHTLTINEIPSHTHKVMLRPNGNIGSYWGDASMTNADAANPTEGGSTTSTGGGQAHNNLQPYITCYMWKRVS